ncbi:MAG: zinc-dependent peptidase [Deltaproteobacteria bacterium]|nr:zinc-dependent peptidase [Deltaproteobacteria bacterium]
MLRWLTERRRRRILATPFPTHWDWIIDTNVAIARRLDPERRARLRDLVQVFVAVKHWEGCGGMEVDDEVKVTIAAQACILILEREAELYRDVDSILVYPSSVKTSPRQPGFFEQPRVMAGQGAWIHGEAMLGGPVVLAWDQVLAGGREETSGNVVFHELAHKLDMASGSVNGTPPLPNKRERKRWAEVCTEAYLKHRKDVEEGFPTLMDSYGATNEAEFFAVATETFFCRPAALAIEHPRVYAALADFYRIAPFDFASHEVMVQFS